MKLFLILSSLVVVRAGVIKETDCDGVVINDVYHEKEILKTDLDRPYLLAVDYSKNTVYFSYSVNTEEDIFKTARLNINTKEFIDIEGINNGFAQTVDAKTHDVYIGGSEGLYKYNYNTNKADFIGEKDSNIWAIYFRNVLYYSVYPSQFLYTFINGTSNRFKDLEDTKVDNFVIDNEDDMFFTNATGLYSQKKGTKNAILYQAFDGPGVRGLTIDVNGNVYVCFQDGIYSVKKASTSISKIVDIEDAFGVAFDNDNNILYADATSVVRLKPTKDKTC